MLSQLTYSIDTTHEHLFLFYLAFMHSLNHLLIINKLDHQIAKCPSKRNAGTNTMTNVDVDENQIVPIKNSVVLRESRWLKIMEISLSSARWSLAPRTVQSISPTHLLSVSFLRLLIAPQGLNQYRLHSFGRL